MVTSLLLPFLVQAILVSPVASFVNAWATSPVVHPRHSYHKNQQVLQVLRHTGQPSSTIPSPHTTTAGAAEQLQHAGTPEEILEVASTHVGLLKWPHLSSAVLRMGRALIQPEQTDRRAGVVYDERMGLILGRCTESLLEGRKPPLSWRPAHLTDMVLGVALLSPPSPLGLGLTTQCLKALASMKDLGGALNSEDITNLSWACQKLGLDLPVAFVEATTGLPFRLRIGALDGLPGLTVDKLRAEVAFRADTQMIGGKLVPEPRLTAWQGVAPFYYSGKEMAACAMTPLVSEVRDKVAEVTGHFYDCVLLNLYMDGSIGIKFHVDPDQGSLWSTNTAVVSVGGTREFVLRKLGDHNVRHRFTVSSGDVMEMFGACQEEYQHAIRVVGRDEVGPRVSLVFKQALVLGGQGQAKDKDR